MEQGVFDISEDAKNSSIVSGARCRHELADKMNSMNNIRPSNSKINKTAAKLSI